MKQSPVWRRWRCRRRFRRAARTRRLGALGYLLQASLLHGDVSSFLAVVDKKLARRSMNTSQRVFWLAAGAFASSEAYLNKLEAYVVESGTAEFDTWRNLSRIATFPCTVACSGLNPRHCSSWCRRSGPSTDRGLDRRVGRTGSAATCRTSNRVEDLVEPVGRIPVSGLRVRRSGR